MHDPLHNAPDRFQSHVSRHRPRLPHRPKVKVKSERLNTMPLMWLGMGLILTTFMVLQLF